MSPVLTLAFGFLALAVMALVGIMIEYVTREREKKVLDETLPPPEWHCRKLRSDDYVVQSGRER